MSADGPRVAFGRHGVVVGGPNDGQDFTVLIPESMPWPVFSCRQPVGGEWTHYVHEGEGRYRFLGPCATVDHEGVGPHDHADEPCCCGQVGCDGTGPWPTIEP